MYYYYLILYYLFVLHYGPDSNQLSIIMFEYHRIKISPDKNGHIYIHTVIFLK